MATGDCSGGDQATSKVWGGGFFRTMWKMSLAKSWPLGIKAGWKFQFF